MSFGQGGPYGPGGSQPPTPPTSSTPDWAALADDTARRGRRRKWLLIGGGVLAAGAVAAIVATAVVSSDGKGGASDQAGGLPTPQKLPSESVTPEPSFSHVAPPAPPDPVDILSSAKKDKAPLSDRTLFPDAKATANDRTYDKGLTSATKSCATAAQGALGGVLTQNGCRRFFRATYARDGVAVTVGIAVFDDKAAAEKAKKQARPNVASLPGGGVPAFCRKADCIASANAIGRYAYFTISGYTSGKGVASSSDPKASQAGRDVSDYAFRRILARGNAQASAVAAAGAS
ncbi:hypothetical protein [Streptomyces sp. XD-27]|uniref:hypothetical protein n=1 Tax=Streptomyces sp. XD-27 TaxID=3062779 RepID=UPI0026F42AD8|nr:hypothetical protein [Streptomyces sp. XD-27]WKX72036.1 hypothetical protein Q3Y56_20910 [Streptomyces sp. XD-27]